MTQTNVDFPFFRFVIWRFSASMPFVLGAHMRHKRKEPYGRRGGTLTWSWQSPKAKFSVPRVLSRCLTLVQCGPMFSSSCSEFDFISVNLFFFILVRIFLLSVFNWQIEFLWIYFLKIFYFGEDVLLHPTGGSQCVCDNNIKTPPWFFLEFYRRH